MDRIFQHYEGEITEFTGLSFSQVKSFIDKDDNDVILLWLKVYSKNIWYRIFIDGAYCGIDKYLDDESENDFDDCIRVRDYSPKFTNQKVLKSEVINTIEAKDFIKLLIHFEQNILELSCIYGDGICQLNFSDKHNEASYSIE